MYWMGKLLLMSVTISVCRSFAPRAVRQQAGRQLRVRRTPFAQIQSRNYQKSNISLFSWRPSFLGLSTSSSESPREELQPLQRREKNQQQQQCDEDFYLQPAPSALIDLVSKEFNFLSREKGPAKQMSEGKQDSMSKGYGAVMDDLRNGILEQSVLSPSPPANAQKAIKTTYLNRHNITAADWSYADKFLSKITQRYANVTDDDIRNDPEGEMFKCVCWLYVYRLNTIGSSMSQSFLATHLYILSRLPSSVIGGSDMFNEISKNYDDSFGMTEAVLSIRVKVLVEKGMVREAMDLLRSVQLSAADIEAASKKGQEKSNKKNLGLTMRNYSPIFFELVREGSMHGVSASAVYEFFVEMRVGGGRKLTEKHYIALIKYLAKEGYFSEEGGLLDGCELRGKELLICLIRQMMEICVDVDHDLAVSLLEAVGSGGSFVEITKKDGVCPATGVKLNQILLTEEERGDMVKALRDLSRTRWEEFTKPKNTGANGVNGNKKRKKKKRKANDDDQSKPRVTSSNAAEESLANFTNYLDRRTGRKYTAIIDGANVAYYGQNFEGGKFNLFQVNAIAEMLEERGEFPLIVLPAKYASRNFRLTKLAAVANRNQELGLDELALIDLWRDKGILFVSPRLCLDDYYWMAASVCNQTAATEVRAYSVENITDGCGLERAGVRPIIISNDEMRDHRLSLVAPRLFSRWRENQICYFNFGVRRDNSTLVGEDGIELANGGEIIAAAPGERKSWLRRFLTGDFLTVRDGVTVREEEVSSRSESKSTVESNFPPLPTLSNHEIKAVNDTFQNGTLVQWYDVQINSTNWKDTRVQVNIGYPSPWSYEIHENKIEGETVFHFPIRLSPSEKELSEMTGEERIKYDFLCLKITN